MNSLKSWVAEHKLTSIGKITTPCACNGSSNNLLFLFLQQSIPFILLTILGVVKELISYLSNFVPCVGAVWASALGSSLALALKRSPTTKTSLRLIHARYVQGVPISVQVVYMAAVSCSRKGESRWLSGNLVHVLQDARPGADAGGALQRRPAALLRHRRQDCDGWWRKCDPAFLGLIKWRVGE